MCTVKWSVPALCWEDRDHAISKGRGEESGVGPGQTMHGAIKSKTYHEVNTSWWVRGELAGCRFRAAYL